MLHVLETILSKLEGHWYRRCIRRALALHLRGEARGDGLQPISVATHLEIEWRARDVHPWDRSLLAPSEKAMAFVQQSLKDTEAAVERLLGALPNVDVLALKVLDHTTEGVIISGSVSRPDFLARDQQLSIGMRLMYLGLIYHSAGSIFEPLEYDHCPAIRSDGPEFQPEGVLVKAMYRSDVNKS